MNVIATIGGTLAGCLLLAKALTRHAEKLSVQEDPDNVGYFLDGPQGAGIAALRELPSDAFPTCPDYIPEWMLTQCQ